MPVKMDAQQSEADQWLRDARILLRDLQRENPDLDVHARLYYCPCCAKIDVSFGRVEALPDDLPCDACDEPQRTSGHAADVILLPVGNRAARRASARRARRARS